MRLHRSGVWVFASIILSGCLGTAAFAEELVPPAAAEKAVRGLANAGLGLGVELPKTVYYDTLEDGPLYGLTVGVLEGLSWGIARTLVGIYEVVTFPFPAPEGYRPILTPAYPYQPGKTDVAD
jgi:putative exosortase-associated protein (TIGR04073 family)